MNENVKKIIDNIEKIIIGKRNVIEHLMVALLSEGHVLIEDVPGVGKTQVVGALAKSVDGAFNRIQFTPDIMPSDVVGFSMFDSEKREFTYKPGVVMCNFLLADEINRSSPKCQSSLLEVMEEFQVTVDGKRHDIPRPFMVLATENPVEHQGNYKLPEAQMDRFLLKVSMGYPNKEEEKLILDRFESKNPLKELESIITIEELINMQEQVKEVIIFDNIKYYIVDLIQETRKNPKVLVGISPRGGISLLKAAKSLAYIRGRDYVIPDDIQEMAVPVLAHRLILKSSIGTTNEEIIKETIKNVEVPLY
ncbi:MoxR family ATPase [Clostridium bornimense]|uniref:AAA family ATPase n=1 Tax=Clostridium bornimense TaxID=1216932 RepID=UPI001C119D0D|nr:MoxR family ATPase [Clostridium bornimense]MBU5316478.1 MoxR family ATPase [Clostridium bornimense]